MRPVWVHFYSFLAAFVLFGSTFLPAQSTSPAEPVNIKEKALDLFMYNKPAEALPLFETALRQSPDDGDLYLYLATCYEQLGDIEASIRTFEQGLSRAGGKKTHFLHNLGNNYYKLEQYDQALKMYNQALQANSRLPGPYLNRANIFVRQGDYMEAIADYRVFLNLEPNTEQRENIEKMINLLNDKIVLAERQRQEEERLRREEELRQQELLQQVLDSLEESGEETQNLSAGTGDVKEYEQEFDIVD